ncbi:hypothetical protein BKA62DRAFT_776860 [Auriculariales sp. MPI-PUGE-AT-0066]|nr:hypothetical protein BKA62DRAFT_776860 [Auriculariales sp. MPI-PUGE-AT-0066]
MDNPTKATSNITRASDTTAAPQVAMKPYLALPSRSAPLQIATDTSNPALGQAAPPTTPHVLLATAPLQANGRCTFPQNGTGLGGDGRMGSTYEAAEGDSDCYDFLKELFGDSDYEDGEGCEAKSLQRDAENDINHGQKKPHSLLTLPSAPTPQPYKPTDRRANPAPLPSETTPGEKRPRIKQPRARATAAAAASPARQPQQLASADRSTPVVVHSQSASRLPITQQAKSPTHAICCTRVEAPTAWCTCTECGARQPPLIGSPSPMAPPFWPCAVPPWVLVAYDHSERLRAGKYMQRHVPPTVSQHVADVHRPRRLIAPAKTLPSQVGSVAPSQNEVAKKVSEEPKERQAEPSAVKRARSAAKEQTRTAKEDEKARIKKEEQERIAAETRAEKMRKVNGSEMTAKFRNPRGYSWLQPAAKTSRSITALPLVSAAANIAAASSHAESSEGSQSAGKRKREGQDKDNAEGAGNKRLKRTA